MTGPERPPHLVLLVHGLGGRGAHLGHHHHQVGGTHHPAHQEEVGEGEIGQELPLGDQTGEVIGLGLAEIGPLGDEVREGHGPMVGRRIEGWNRPVSGRRM
jgi:hypothetical protein